MRVPSRSHIVIFMIQSQKSCSIPCFVEAVIKTFQSLMLFFLENGKVLESDVKSKNIALMTFRECKLLHEESGTLLHYGGSIK